MFPFAVMLAGVMYPPITTKVSTFWWQLIVLRTQKTPVCCTDRTLSVDPSSHSILPPPEGAFNSSNGVLGLVLHTRVSWVENMVSPGTTTATSPGSPREARVPAVSGIALNTTLHAEPLRFGDLIRCRKLGT